MCWSHHVFGDILSDEAAGVVGSLASVPVANIGASRALFEPFTEVRPDIGRKGHC